MTGKIILHLSYILFGVYLTILYPWMKFIQKRTLFNFPIFITKSFQQSEKVLSGIALIVGIAGLALLPFHFVILAMGISFLLTTKENNRFSIACAIFIGIIFSSFLGTFLHSNQNRLSLTLFQSLQFFFITSISYIALLENHKDSYVSRPSFYKMLINITFFLIFFLIAFYFAFEIRINLNIDHFYQWHHWSAFLGQAQLISSGAIPFNDTPVQYGFGPAAITALICNSYCWLNFYYLSSFFTFLLTVIVGFLGYKLAKPSSHLQKVSIFLITLSVCIFWPPYQNTILSITTFPSITGIRFLPSMVLLLFTFVFFYNPPKTKFFKLSSTFILFFLWGICIAWSPDAGIQATVVFFPYYFWMNIYDLKVKSDLFDAGFILLKLILFSLITLSFIFLIFFIVYKEFPNLNNYIIYLQNLPAAVKKVNSNGMIWIAIFVCALWLIFCQTSTSLRNQKLIWLVSLLAFANFTYFLSHNHDSVIADLLPYFYLILLGIYGHSIHGPLRSTARILLAAIIGWSSLMLGWQNVLVAADQNLRGDIKSFFIDSPNLIISGFNRQSSNPFALTPRSQYESSKNHFLQLALIDIRAIHNDPVEVFDEWLLIGSEEKNLPWSSFHGPVTFMPLSIPAQKYFLERFRKKFPRSGWILYDKDFPMASILQLFDSIYVRGDELEFQFHRAIYYSPK